MEDGFVAHLQPVFVVGRHVGYLRLQVAVTVVQQLIYKTLVEDYCQINIK